MDLDRLTGEERAELQKSLAARAKGRIRVLIEHIAGRAEGWPTTATRYKTIKGQLCEVIDLGSTLAGGLELEAFVHGVPLDGKTHRQGSQ
jgi:hypothetical protein